MSDKTKTNFSRKTNRLNQVNIDQDAEENLKLK